MNPRCTRGESVYGTKLYTHMYFIINLCETHYEPKLELKKKPELCVDTMKP